MNYKHVLLEHYSYESSEHHEFSGIVTFLRKYPYGSRIRMHVGEVESGHIIGSILQAAQDTPVPWGLHLVDHGGQEKVVQTFPGDMVLFESASVIHGRPSVFQGNSYINAFFYFKPKEWNLDLDLFKQQLYKGLPGFNSNYRSKDEL